MKISKEGEMGKFIIGIIIGIIVIVFMVQNVEVVEVSFFAWSVSIPRAIMILIVFVVGIGLGFVVRSIGYRKKKMKVQRQEEELRQER
jgi:putative membrane protein